MIPLAILLTGELSEMIDWSTADEAFVGDKLSKRGQDEKVPGTNGDRDQQRKLVRIKKTNSWLVVY